MIQTTFLSISVGRGSIPPMMYSAASCKINPRHIIFLHSISTPPPPPSVLKRRKNSMHTKLQLQQLAATLNVAEATSSQIAPAGERFLIEMYGGMKLIRFEVSPILRFKNPKIKLA